MEILTSKQAVLDLILHYWDSPSPNLLKTTLSSIHEIGPEAAYLSWPYWDFDLTRESLKKLSLKYLNQEVSFKIEDENHGNEFLLTGPVGDIRVNSQTLIMKVLMREDIFEELANAPFKPNKEE